MFTIYAIKSAERNYIYIGFTENLDRRINEHNKDKTRSTKASRPFTLLYQEKCNTRKEARAREKYLKSGIGKEFLKSLL